MKERNGIASRIARIGACLGLAFCGGVTLADGMAPSISGQIDGYGTASKNFEAHVTFACSGSPTCIGTYQLRIRDSGCSNFFSLAGPLQVTGLNVLQPGAVGGTIALLNAEFDDTQNADGTCSIKPGAIGTHYENYTGTWDGTQGTILINGVNDAGTNPYVLTGSFKASGIAPPPPPVFPMIVTSNIDAVQASASAQIQFRPEDVGKQGSVYVFAIAPATVVKNAKAAKRAAGDPMAAYAWKATGGDKDSIPVPCVLAQLTDSGQLAGVSTDAMKAFVTGLLGSAGQAVTIVNGVPTVNVAGATFYVGYGSSAAAMLNNGVNRSAVTVPGTRVCQPKPPQTGWWWNPNEAGRGYSIEVRGNNLFFASFLYADTGRSTWYVSPGPASLDGTLFSGTLYSASGGQTLGGAYGGGPATRTEGAITLAFDSDSTGTMVWPGGTVAIQRMNLVPGGLAMARTPGQPESGWWWNENESGRGFFLEWQGNTLDIAGYMYDDAGNPVWYITFLNTSDPMGAVGHGVDGAWWSFADGQTLKGAWKQNTETSDHVAPLHIDFTGSDTALMTLPNGRTTSLTRQRF